MNADFSYLSSDTFDLDLDGDGVAESKAQLWDADGDGIQGGYLIESDLNHDGISDFTSIAYEIDSNGDGTVDAVQWDVYEDNHYWEQYNDTSGDPEDPDFVQVDDETNIDDFVITTTDMPTEETPEAVLVGNPTYDDDCWHQQTYSDTCAIVSQEFILDQLTGTDVSEEELRQEAIDKGYYTPGAGTPLNQIGRLLEDRGIEVEHSNGNTLEDLSAKLEQGQKVIVAVDSEEIWTLGQPDSQEDYLDDFSEASGYIPGQDSNHAVQVIGIDYSDPDNPMVILNDPGHPEGQGKMIPADEFIDAWDDSNNFMVATTGNTLPTYTV